MADLTPIPSAQRPADSGYQPLSGYAVAAIVVATAFAMILLALVISALVSRRSVIFWELLALPIVGIILAAIARSHIRNSEGTRTGARMANSSWWICVLGGAGFAAYIYANTLALEIESGRFADEMFKELQAGRVQDAFENRLVPPDERGRVGPNAPPDVFATAYVDAGYTAFRNHDLVRLFGRNGQSVEFERIGVKDVGQEDIGLQATHIYRLRCPEGVFETHVKVVASESRKGGKALWRIPALPIPSITQMTIVEPSQYGRMVSELGIEGEQFARAWARRLNTRNVSLAQLMTTPFAHYKPIEDALGQLMVLGGGPAALFPPGPDMLPADRAAAWREKAKSVGKKDDSGNVFNAEDLPFEDLSRIGFFQRDEQATPFPDDRRLHLREMWRMPHLMPIDIQGVQIDASMPLANSIVFKPDRITVLVQSNLFFEGRVIHVRATIGVECTDPVTLAAVNSARERGTNDKGDGSLALQSMPPRAWRIAWFRTDMEPKQPVGPGVPGGGR